MKQFVVKRKIKFVNKIFGGGRALGQTNVLCLL